MVEEKVTSFVKVSSDYSCLYSIPLFLYPLRPTDLSLAINILFPVFAFSTCCRSAREAEPVGDTYIKRFTARLTLIVGAG